MRDMEIRSALRSYLEECHRGEPGTRVINELGLCQGQVRIDLAVVNGSLNGFEIKSDQDTLDRLPGQEAAYSRVFDYVTLVVSGEHVKSVAAQIPNWWGISEARPSTSGVGVDIVPVRTSEPNPAVDPFALAQLLWRDEAFSLLERAGLSKGLASKPRRVLWQALVTHFGRAQLAFHVRERLKARAGWRADSPPWSNGGSSQPSAKLSHSQVHPGFAHND